MHINAKQLLSSAQSARVRNVLAFSIQFTPSSISCISFTQLKLICSAPTCSKFNLTFNFIHPFHCSVTTSMQKTFCLTFKFPYGVCRQAGDWILKTAICTYLYLLTHASVKTQIMKRSYSVMLVHIIKYAKNAHFLTFLRLLLLLLNTWAGLSYFIPKT